MAKLRIVSDGTAGGTEVFGPNGERLLNVSQVEILPINMTNWFVNARITFEKVELDVCFAKENEPNES